ncbi:MAG: hypothetical protein COA57_11645 [Flavobacteriales bacterium]|nr:MAG: hypothetical protein COA57_11645 [Flavobacteriales bacterium]
MRTVKLHEVLDVNDKLCKRCIDIKQQYKSLSKPDKRKLKFFDKKGIEYSDQNVVLNDELMRLKYMTSKIIKDSSVSDYPTEKIDFAISYYWNKSETRAYIRDKRIKTTVVVVPIAALFLAGYQIFFCESSPNEPDNKISKSESGELSRGVPIIELIDSLQIDSTVSLP